jgi:hypothetical protein
MKASRIAWFLSNPPAARTTPLRAPIRIGLPFCVDDRARHLALVAHQFASGLSSHSGTLRSLSASAARRQRIAQRQAAVLARGEAERPVEPVARQALGQMEATSRAAETAAYRFHRNAS